MASAESIRRIREKNGLSQSQFSDLLGVGLGTLKHWERGDREPSGAARTLLLLISENHNAIEFLLTKSKQ